MTLMLWKRDRWYSYTTKQWTLPGWMFKDAATHKLGVIDDQSHAPVFYGVVSSRTLLIAALTYPATRTVADMK